MEKKINLENLLRCLSPETLRRTILLPVQQIREEFMPRFLSTESYEEFIGEFARFVRHVKKHWLKTGVEWPDEYAEGEARRLLEESVGTREAMKAVRHGDQGGLRWVLDEAMKRLREEAIVHYVDTIVLPGRDDQAGVGQGIGSGLLPSCREWAALQRGRHLRSGSNHSARGRLASFAG